MFLTLRRNFMRPFSFVRTTAIFCALLAVSSSGLFASTIVFNDTFPKSDTALVGTTPDLSTGNWSQTGATATNPIQIVSNKVAMGTTGQDTYAAFSSSVSNSGDGSQVHTSMDINVSAAQTGDYFSHLSDPVATTSFFFQRLGAASSGTGYVLQLTVTGGGGAVATSGTTVLNFNQTYHIDEYWTFNAGATNDTFQINVDNASYLSKTWDSTNAEPTQLSAANFRQGGATSSATLTVDNLQVESIAAEVPESGTLGLASVFLLIGIGRSRLKRF
jgi:hypothetical protein